MLSVLLFAATAAQHKKETADDDDGDGKQYGKSHKSRSLKYLSKRAGWTFSDEQK